MSEAPRLPYLDAHFRTTAFNDWIAANRGQVLVSPPHSRYEMVRYKTADGLLHIVYRNERGKLTFTGDSAKHYLIFLSGEEGFSRKSGRIKSARRNGIREALRDRDGDNCWFCAEVMEFGQQQNNPRLATIEHLVSRSRGGSNKRENLVLCCFECNQKLDDLPLVDKIKLRDAFRDEKLKDKWDEEPYKSWLKKGIKANASNATD